MKQIRFGEVAEFRNGLNFGKDSQGKGCLLIGIPDFKDRFSPDYNSLGEINPLGIIKEDDYLEKEDILFVRSNGNKNLVGRSLYIDRDVKAVYSGFCIRARLTSSIVDTLYCAYYTRSDRFRSSISSSGGTNIQNLNQGILSDVKIPLFSVKTQKQIAKVLSDLDAKIEVNNKINAELEAMAKLIYDYWFVQFNFPFDFAQGKPDPNGKPYKSSGGKMVYNKELKRKIPEGWDCNLLGDLGNFKNGVNYDPSNPGEVACPIINVRNISKSSFFLKNEDLDIIYLRETDVRKYAVHEGSIIIARSGIPGATRLIADYEKNTLFCGFAIHYQLENLDQKLTIFFYLKSIEEIIKNGSGGTILKNVNQATLNSLKIALPNSKLVIELFNQKITPIFRKINLIQKENQKLSELRDWLLPMLMNGQVTVANDELGITNAELGNDLGMVAEETQEYKYTK